MEGGASLTDNNLSGEDVLVCMSVAERGEPKRSARAIQRGNEIASIKVVVVYEEWHYSIR